MAGITGDIQRLVEAMLDGALSDAQRTELNELLRSSAEARAIYAKYVHLNLSLERYFGADAADVAGNESAPARSIGKRDEVSDAQLDDLDITPSSALDHLFEQAEDVRRRPFLMEEVAEAKPASTSKGSRQALRLSWSDWRVWSGTAALIALVTIVSMFVFYKPTAIAPATVRMGTDAQLTSDGLKMQEDGNLTVGSHELKDGPIQLRFESGALVKLLPPARFEVAGANELRLDSGKAMCRVPPEARGFTVRAPHDVHVVDLGTEFTIEVDQTGETRVRVDVGTVRVTRQEEIANLSAGDAVLVVDGKPFVNLEPVAEPPVTTISPSTPGIEVTPLHSEADVVNTGLPLVSAANFGSYGKVVVNGIPHASTHVGFGPINFSGPYGKPDPSIARSGDLFKLLDGIAGSRDVNGPSRLNLQGLVVGKTYLFQAYWVVKGTEFNTRRLNVMIQGARRSDIKVESEQSNAVLISLLFVAKGDTFSASFDGRGVDDNDWIAGYSLQEAAK